MCSTLKGEQFCDDAHANVCIDNDACVMVQKFSQGFHVYSHLCNARWEMGTHMCICVGMLLLELHKVIAL